MPSAKKGLPCVNFGFCSVGLLLAPSNRRKPWAARRIFGLSERAGGVAALLTLAKELTLLDRPNSQLPLFRTQWNILSVSSLPRLGRSQNGVVPSASEGSAFNGLFRISPCKQTKANSYEINTYEKMGWGPPPFGRSD